MLSPRLKSLATALLPPIILRALGSRLRRRGWFTGNYSTWIEARADSQGYEDALIVERVLAATLKVKDGAAAYERDSVLFFEPSFEFPLLAALLRSAAEANGRLHVLDFGGALGSTYWRHRAWLDCLPDLRWSVIEQPGFVAAGRRELPDTKLRFFTSIDEAEAEGRHTVLLASTVVQYLEQPPAAIADWLSRGFPYILLNNLPLHTVKPDRLALQVVPPSIYPASYPVWFFNRERFLSRIQNDYQIAAEFSSEAIWPVDGGNYPSTGLLLKSMRHETH
jgi:putative methyltransferase (TIGR04325 family)